MTTIAVRDGVMACDSRSTGEYTMTVEKIYQLPNGNIVGGAGMNGALAAAIKWLQGGEIGEPPSAAPGDDEGFYLLILKPDGTIWRAENAFPAWRVLDSCAATGSGSGLAMGAMAMGASAVEAVKVAAKYDSGTGGRIRTLSLPVAKKQKRRGR